MRPAPALVAAAALLGIAGAARAVVTRSIATADAHIESNQFSAQLGENVSRAGDVDDDGYADLLLAAPLYDGPESNEGAVFIERGEPLVAHSIPALPALGLALLGACVALFARRRLTLARR